MVIQPCVAQNLIKNGDFESWYPNETSAPFWKLDARSTSDGYCLKYTGTGVNGNFAAKLPFVRGGFQPGQIGQWFTPSLTFTTISFRYLFPQISNGKSLKVNILRSDGVDFGTYTIPSSNLDQWQTFSVVRNIVNVNNYMFFLKIFLDNGYDAAFPSPYIVIDDVKVESTADLAVSEENAKLFSIINPVENYLHIKTVEKIDKIEIFSMSGGLVKALKNEERNISELNTGNYILKIISNGDSIIKKIIKK